MGKTIAVPGYPEIRLTESGADLLRRVRDFDQGRRMDDGKRERVFSTSPATGQTAARLVRQGLLRYASASGRDYVGGVESTAAGCVVLAALSEQR